MTGETTQKRPPVVVVLGHVDHGKTTLLDYIRKSNVAEKESGGITQHIGAYQIEHNGKMLTFLDTPGHEAFSEMRRRGAHVADIAILVVAADEGIKPQTLEAARHIENAKLPFVVALNRIDKPNADSPRIKKQLSENNILIEEWGGKVPALEVSAKTGKGIPELLDMLLLLWDLEEIPAETGLSTQGVVIESRLDPRRGPSATILVTSGVLKKNDALICGEAIGKIRILEDFKGVEIAQATASTPVLVTGMETVPVLGDTCEVVANAEEAIRRSEALVEKRKEEQKAADALLQAASAGVVAASKHILPIILKTDTKGSEEAIIEALLRMTHDEVALKIIEHSVGDITEADVKSAESTRAAIMGFRVTLPRAVEQYARVRGVRVVILELIYEFIEGVRKELSLLLPAEIVKTQMGKVSLLAIFKREKDGIIIGGRITSGKVVRGAWCDIVRNGAIVSEGKIRELKIAKDDASEAKEGQECGMLYVGKGEVPQVGDAVEVYERFEKRREL